MSSLLADFRRRLAEGDSVIGPFMKTGDPAFVEAAGYAGFDFVILDTEHGPVSIENMQNNVRAALVAGALPIIRVQDDSASSIGKALDIGAFGVQIPQVQTAQEAQAAIRKAKFYPKGERGVCRFVRAAQYSALERSVYFQAANDTLVILQLEGTEAIDNIDSILQVPDIDILFIGPYDLSQSLGIPGETSHPKVVEQMQFIVEKARSAGIVVGTFVDQLEAIQRWKDAGVQYISYSVDVGIFVEACKQIVKLHCNG
ncbi:MAG: HpcH/HpaI aldolase family protein [Limnochordia bacterium]|jgi:4-hydroxy-2-oxoheptanedioate aldolase